MKKIYTQLVEKNKVFEFSILFLVDILLLPVDNLLCYYYVTCKAGHALFLYGPLPVGGKNYGRNE